MHSGAQWFPRSAPVKAGSAAATAAALAFAALAFFIAWGCSSAPGGQRARDEVWRQKIVGSWAEGNSPYGVSTFLPGGGYRGAMYLSAERRVVLMTMEGRWWIEGGRLYSRADKIEMLQPLPIAPDTGKVSVDVIVDITDDTMRLIDSKGKEYVNKRVHGEGATL
jgi:hypothetical protein